MAADRPSFDSEGGTDSIKICCGLCERVWAGGAGAPSSSLIEAHDTPAILEQCGQSTQGVMRAGLPVEDDERRRSGAGFLHPEIASAADIHHALATA